MCLLAVRDEASVLPLIPSRLVSSVSNGMLAEPEACGISSKVMME
jgi:hypothetical protein